MRSRDDSVFVASIRRLFRSDSFRMIAGSLALAILVWELLSILYPGRSLSVPLWICNLSEGPCQVFLPDRMILDVTPRPIVAGDLHHIRFLTADNEAARVEVELSSVDLDMGTAHAELKRMGDAFEGEVQMPVCVHSTLKWQALVTVYAKGSVQRMTFYWKNRRQKTVPQT